jgi:phosphopantetheinyl transferase
LPILFQHTINNKARLSVWKIEEPEEYFTEQITLPHLPANPHKRLQHLAGRYLLKQMLPDFPVEKIVAVSGNKPYLSDHSYQFSISHSSDIAAAIISHEKQVGIDIEIISDKAIRVGRKFLHENELHLATKDEQADSAFHHTLMWSIKETIFKWYGLGSVDFREDMLIKKISFNQDENMAECFFRKTDQVLDVRFTRMKDMVVSWLVSPPLKRGIYSNEL